MIREDNMADHKTYFGRYYVLVVVTLLAVQQNIAWVTFSGIADSAKSSYGLTDDEITLLPGEFVTDRLVNNTGKAVCLFSTYICVSLDSSSSL